MCRPPCVKVRSCTTTIYKKILTPTYWGKTKKGILNSKSSSEGELSFHLKKVFQSIEKSEKPDATPIWDLIGHKKLMDADAKELFQQFCDLLDAENDMLARNTLGVEIHHEIKVPEASSVRNEFAYDIGRGR